MFSLLKYSPAGRGDGLVGKMLVAQPWRPELGSPASIWKLGVVAHTCSFSVEDTEKWGPCWLASLYKLVSSRFNERPFLKKLGGRKLRKTHDVYLQPPDTPAHIHTHTWTHRPTHIDTIKIKINWRFESD